MADLEGLKNLRDKYAKTIPGKILEMEQLVERADFKGLKMAVHQIAGNAGGYGFMGASRLSAAFEAKLAEGATSEACRDYLGQLKEAFQDGN